jgi:hypothetical protein
VQSGSVDIAIATVKLLTLPEDVVAVQTGSFPQHLSFLCHSGRTPYVSLQTISEPQLSIQYAKTMATKTPPTDEQYRTMSSNGGCATTLAFPQLQRPQQGIVSAPLGARDQHLATQARM